MENHIPVIILFSKKKKKGRKHILQRAAFFFLPVQWPCTLSAKIPMNSCRKNKKINKKERCVCYVLAVVAQEGRTVFTCMVCYGSALVVTEPSLRWTAAAVPEGSGRAAVSWQGFCRCCCCVLCRGMHSPLPSSLPAADSCW